MIVDMSHVRILGPRAELRATLAVLQDAGVLHLIEAAPRTGLHRHATCAAEQRRRRHLERALADAEAALTILAELGGAAMAEQAAPVGRAARVASRVRVRAERLRARRQALLAERDALRAYQPLLVEFEAVLAATPHRFSAYLLQLREHGGTQALDRVRAALAGRFGPDHELLARALPGGETGLLLLVPASRAPEIDELLDGAHLDTAPVPASLGSLPLSMALPRLRVRLAEVERLLLGLALEAAALVRDHGGILAGLRRRAHDELIEIAAHPLAAESSRAFVLEGWLPARERQRLAQRLHRALGSMVSLEEVSRGEWHGEQAPVVLANPAVFEPFERLTALLPLPRYGSVDPTPFVAVFFPMLFGIVAGDVGYGLIMAAIAGALVWHAPPRGPRRDLAKIGGAMAAYTVIFGLLYGELFGDLGRRIGLEPIWLDREEAILPFLGFAIALGVAHLVIGLFVGMIAGARGHPRQAFGRGLTLFMLLCITTALLATFERLPAALFTPAIVALLVAFPLLIVAEGVTGLIELMSVVGHVLSYARVMALGVASVMLAVVANRMVGAFGSVAIGLLFALLFHLVNFAIGLFSPTIQVLRLHYVEFFGTFFSPGGVRYQPLTHWTPVPPGPGQEA